MKDFGLQLYTLREQMKDGAQIREAFRRIAEFGYTEVQTAGDPPVSAKEFRAMADEVGLKIIGTHISLESILNDTERVMEDHRIFGTTNIGIGGLPGTLRSPEGLAQMFADLEKPLALMHTNGFKFTYHHHSFEFEKFEDGRRLIEILIEKLPIDKTSFVLDTYWLQHAGVTPSEWIEKLSGRVSILHLKDMRIVGNAPTYASVGDGNINFNTIFKAAKAAGVQHYIVEQDSCEGDPFDSVAASANYLKTIEL